VHYVIKTLVDPKAPYHLANHMMADFAAPGSGWREVMTTTEAAALANQGVVVVGGLAEPGKHGHVIIVFPGPMKASGGYVAHGKTMRSHGLFPLAMSTSLGSWPGAVSDGTKTVFDPWASDAIFKRVTFWTPATK
jgi:hypothetical protein